MNVQIAELEKAKNDYVKKNKDQVRLTDIVTYLFQNQHLVVYHPWSTNFICINP